MLDYDREAAWYDETRGGEPRAKAAADAIAGLLPAGCRVVLDVAGGTGIVSGALAAYGYSVVVCDRSTGMLRVACTRLPGRAVAGDATALPLADSAVDAVTIIWLLHLLPDAEPVLAECVRVLRPGGVLLTTVDKSAAHRAADGWTDPHAAKEATDARPRIESLAAGLGLVLHGETTFLGLGQGRPSTPPVYPLLSFVKRSKKERSPSNVGSSWRNSAGVTQRAAATSVASSTSSAESAGSAVHQWSTYRPSSVSHSQTFA